MTPPPAAGMVGKADTDPTIRICSGTLSTGRLTTEPTRWRVAARNALVAIAGITRGFRSQLIWAASAPCGVPFGPAGNRVMSAGSLSWGAADGNGPLPVLVTRIGPIRRTPVSGLDGGAKDTPMPASRSG